MKSLPFIYLLFLIHVVFSFAITAEGMAASGPANELSQLTILEELSALLHKSGRIVEIEGAIKNISKSTLKGYVTVYLLGVNGEVINAKDKVIARGLEFGPGMMAKFTVTMKIGRRKKVESISVDFVRD